MIKRVCLKCKTVFFVKSYVVKKGYGKFCSRICQNTSKEMRDAIRNSRLGEKHWNWKGDNVGYSALHRWLRKNFGNPIKCSKCGQLGEKIGRKWNIEWANKNKQYTRDIENWIGLCGKCHREYDGTGFKKGNTLWKKLTRGEHGRYI